MRPPNTVANIDYRCIRVEDLAAEQPHSFDVVTCMEMMEHVPDPAAIVQACAKLVKPDGMVFFSTINRNPKSYLHLIVGAEYLLKFVPKGTHDWKKFITPAELARMCRQAGLDTVGSKGMTYNFVERPLFPCAIRLKSTTWLPAVRRKVQRIKHTDLPDI